VPTQLQFNNNNNNNNIIIIINQNQMNGDNLKNIMCEARRVEQKGIFKK
jgi:hypothetical protein